MAAKHYISGILQNKPSGIKILQKRSGPNMLAIKILPFPRGEGYPHPAPHWERILSRRSLSLQPKVPPSVHDDERHSVEHHLQDRKERPTCARPSASPLSFSRPPSSQPRN